MATVSLAVNAHRSSFDLWNHMPSNMTSSAGMDAARLSLQIDSKPSCLSGQPPGPSLQSLAEGSNQDFLALLGGSFSAPLSDLAEASLADKLAALETADLVAALQQQQQQLLMLQQQELLVNEAAAATAAAAATSTATNESSGAPSAEEDEIDAQINRLWQLKQQMRNNKQQAQLQQGVVMDGGFGANGGAADTSPRMALVSSSSLFGPSTSGIDTQQATSGGLMSPTRGLNGSWTNLAAAASAMPVTQQPGSLSVRHSVDLGGLAQRLASMELSSSNAVMMDAAALGQLTSLSSSGLGYAGLTSCGTSMGLQSTPEAPGLSDLGTSLASIPAVPESVAVNPSLVLQSALYAPTPLLGGTAAPGLQASATLAPVVPAAVAPRASMDFRQSMDMRRSIDVRQSLDMRQSFDTNGGLSAAAAAMAAMAAPLQSPFAPASLAAAGLPSGMVGGAQQEAAAGWDFAARRARPSIDLAAAAARASTEFAMQQQHQLAAAAVAAAAAAAAAAGQQHGCAPGSRLPPRRVMSTLTPSEGWRQPLDARRDSIDMHCTHTSESHAPPRKSFSSSGCSLTGSSAASNCSSGGGRRGSMDRGAAPVTVQVPMRSPSSRSPKPAGAAAAPSANSGGSGALSTSKGTGVFIPPSMIKN